MHSGTRIRALLLNIAAFIMIPALPVLGISYGDFAGSLNGSFGQSSGLDFALIGIWMVALTLALLWAGRRSSARRQQQVEIAYQRMMARKARNQALLQTRRTAAGVLAKSSRSSR